MSPQLFTGRLFALTYHLIMTGRVNRAIIVLVAADRFSLFAPR